VTETCTTSRTEAPGPSLTARAVGGAAWVFCGKGAARLLTAVRLVVLARLLAPEDFGLFGIVLLSIATLETFSQTGFDLALIQRKEDVGRYLDTAWTVHVVRGLLLGGLLYAVAPAVGRLFGDQRAVPLLRAMSLVVAVDGLRNIGIVYFRKELRFHRLVAFDLAAEAASLAVAVVLAYRLRSVWAFVWAALAASAVRCALSYVMHPYRPRLRFAPAQAAELFRYGRWVLASSILILLIRHGDDAFVGKVLGVAALGVYQLAYRISNMAATEITHTVSAVAMPAYAQMQEEASRLRRWYLKVLSGTLLLAAPVAAGTAAVAPMFVGVALGPKWADALVPIQILCIFGLLRAVAATAGPVFLGGGRPQYLARSTALEAACMAALIWPATARWGVQGTCAAVTLAIFLTLFYVVGKLRLMLRMRVRDLLGCVAGSLLPSLAMFAVVSGLGRLVRPGWWGLGLLVAAGAVTYAGLLAALVSRAGGGALGLATQQTLRSLRAAGAEILSRARPEPAGKVSTRVDTGTA